MSSSRYRRSGKERRQFDLRFTHSDRRSGYDRRRVRDRRRGLDRRDPKGQRGWFPLGRRRASGETTVIALPESNVLKIKDAYGNRKRILATEIKCKRVK